MPLDPALDAGNLNPDARLARRLSALEARVAELSSLRKNPKITTWWSGGGGQTQTYNADGGLVFVIATGSMFLLTGDSGTVQLLIDGNFVQGTNVSSEASAAEVAFAPLTKSPGVLTGSHTFTVQEIAGGSLTSTSITVIELPYAA